MLSYQLNTAYFQVAITLLLISGFSGNIFVSGTAYSGSSPIAFYFKLSSSGSLSLTRTGQYGSTLSVLDLPDYQGNDGPYLFGQETPGRLFVYKFSQLLGLIDRFVYPKPGSAVNSALTAGSAALQMSKSNGHDSPQAIFVVGTETEGTSQKFFLMKLSESWLSLA